MARRAAYIKKQFGNYNNSNLLHLDAGGFSPLSQRLNEGKTRALLASYQKMALAGINVASKDIGNDFAAFYSLSREYKLPMVSTNLVYLDSGESVFNKSLQVDFAGRSITIMGITKETRVQWQDEKGRQIVTADPKERIKRILEELDSGETVVLLAYMPHREMKQLLAGVNGIELVLACDGYSQTTRIEQVGETTVLYPGSQGKYLGKVALNREDNSLINQNPSS